MQLEQNCRCLDFNPNPALLRLKDCSLDRTLPHCFDHQPIQGQHLSRSLRDMVTNLLPRILRPCLTSPVMADAARLALQEHMEEGEKCGMMGMQNAAVSKPWQLRKWFETLTLPIEIAGCWRAPPRGAAGWADDGVTPASAVHCSVGRRGSAHATGREPGTWVPHASERDSRRTDGDMETDETGFGGGVCVFFSHVCSHHCVYSGHSIMSKFVIFFSSAKW